MKSIRWDRRRKCFVMQDGTSADKWGSFSVESALDVSLSSLRRALARQAGVSVSPLSSLPAPESYRSQSEFDESVLEGPNAEIVFDSNEPESNVLFFFLSRQGHVRAHFEVENPAVDDRNIVLDIATRIFSRPRDLVQQLRKLVATHDDPSSWSFEMICDAPGRTVGSIWQAYKTLCFALTTLPEDLAKSVKGVEVALRLGRPDALIGAPESSWLDVKSKNYFLSSMAEKIKLAQDVVRFANADGGILGLGLRTSKSNGVDIISKITPLPMPARPVARYRSIIDTHVYPLVRGLDVFGVPYANGELLVIIIPRQSDDDKPFVVHGNLGSITDNKIKGIFVSVVQRRGDGAEYLSGPAIHGLLAARRMRLAE